MKLKQFEPLAVGVGNTIWDHGFFPTRGKVQSFFWFSRRDPDKVAGFEQQMRKALES